MKNLSALWHAGGNRYCCSHFLFVTQFYSAASLMRSVAQDCLCYIRFFGGDLLQTFISLLSYFCPFLLESTILGQLFGLFLVIGFIGLIYSFFRGCLD